MWSGSIPSGYPYRGICDGGAAAGEQQARPARRIWAAAGLGPRQAAGAPLIWAVEGDGHYGLNLARHQGAGGQQVAEISHSPYVSKRRAGNPTRLMRCGRPGTARRPHPAVLRAVGTAKRSGF